MNENPITERGRSTTDVITAGPLRIDIAEHRATLDGRDLDLSPLLMRLLHMLADHPRQLVTRQQIKRELWPNSDLIDTERRLNTAMRALRAALDDDADAPRFIETVRSQGYRWIGSGPAARRRRSLAPKILAIAVVLAAVIGVAFLVLAKAEPAAEPLPVDLVRAQTALDQWRAEPDAAHLRTTDQAITAALGSSPASPAAHVLKAQLALESQWNWDVAAREYGAALDLDPSNTDARLGLAWLKVNRGDEANALADANQLMLSSVLAGDRRIDLGWLLIRAGRPDLAVTACPTSTRSINGLSCAHTALAAVGQLKQARDAAIRLMRATNAKPDVVRQIERMPAEQGYKQFLAWRAREFLPSDSFYFDRAQVLADAGFDTEAIDMLSRSVDAHEPLAVKIRSSPAFMKLRTNPRYQALAAKVGA